jgi:hypothetical protein
LDKLSPKLGRKCNKLLQGANVHGAKLEQKGQAQNVNFKKMFYEAELRQKNLWSPNNAKFMLGI